MLVHELPNQQRERDESHAPEGGAFGVKAGGFTCWFRLVDLRFGSCCSFAFVFRDERRTGGKDRRHG